MPKFSSSTLAKGARQLVVQEAFEMMLCTSGSYWSSLTPMTMVMSSSLAGQVMTTFLAPASRCFCASSPVLKMPVASTTTSTPSSPQGRFAGSRSESMVTCLPSTTKPSSVTSISKLRMPWMESYFSR